MMLPKHPLSVLALGSLLAACTFSPTVEVPASGASPAAAPAAAPTTTPAPSAAPTALPASPTPARSIAPAQQTGVEPVRLEPTYQEAALGLTIGEVHYRVSGDATAGYVGKASMAVRLAGQAPTTIGFEEFDGPDTGSSDDLDDHVTITDNTTGHTQTFGADQGMVNLWVGDLEAPRVYRTQSDEPRFHFNDWRLFVQFLGGGTYLINDYRCPMPLEDAARTAAHSPQLRDVSIAGLSALYAVLRERPFNDDSLGLEAFYRVRQGLAPSGTRIVMPAYPKDIKKGSGFGRYGVMSEGEVAQNPAAALLRAVIELRQSDGFDPTGDFEAIGCEPILIPVEPR